MNKKDDALKLALEALREIERLPGISSANLYARDAIKAIDALAEQPAKQRHISYVCPQCYWSLEEQPAQREPTSKAIAECLEVLRPLVKGKWPQEQALEELAGYLAALQPAPVAEPHKQQSAERVEQVGHGGRPMTLRECMEAEDPASKPWVGLMDEEITAGAQALCQQMAEACNVDPGDQWNLYADTFKEDAKAVLTAAAKLREKNA